MSVVRAATTAGIATALSRVLGFVRVLVVVWVLGTTYLGNTFQSSNLISNVLFELIAAGALSAVLVPTFVTTRENSEEFDRLVGGLLLLAVVVLGAIALLGILFAPVVASVLTTGINDHSIREEQRELSTFLLRFFIPQVVLYAVGTITIAVLHAHRRFVLAAIAPAASTVVMVGFLLAFRTASNHNQTGIGLSTGQKLLLACAGTLAVVAYVCLPAGAAVLSGLRPKLHWPRRSSPVWRLLRQSGWATLIHVAAGGLLGTALVLGNSIAGGSVAYNAAFVFFLAPWAILAQPLQNAVLPEFAEASPEVLQNQVRWSLHAVSRVVAPVSALMLALALPAMRAVTFGDQARSAELVAAGLAALAAGLVPYSLFLLLSRVFFAQHAAHIPAYAALAGMICGVTFMFVAVPSFNGAGRVAALGVGHTIAYVVAAAVAFVSVRRSMRSILAPQLLRVFGVAVIVGLLAWVVANAWSVDGRIASGLQALALGGLGFGLSIGMTRSLPKVLA